MPRLVGTFLLALFATSALAQSSPAVPAPRVDHHQHLESPMVAAMANRMPPEVELPGELRALLRDRAAAWNDAARLRELFVDEGTVFTGGIPGWSQGARKSADFLSRRFARPYRLFATSMRIRADHASIVGYYARGEGETMARVGYFDMALERTRDQWRIVSETPAFPGPQLAKVEDAADLVRFLDDAGIGRAVVLSDAYYFDSPRNEVADPYAKVRAENDWTAEQVARFPSRLVAFCSFNPLAQHALEELERCAQSRRFTGIKLHFGTSGVDLLDAAHVAKVRAVVERANALRLPLIVHVRASPKDYGREHARILIERIVAAAPDVVFQVAHLWGGEAFSDEALEVYANAVASRDPRVRNLYFDIAEAALVAGGDEAIKARIVERMRQIGLDRVLYATDGPVAESQAPADGWKSTQGLPLTRQELARIAANVAPYLREPKEAPLAELK